MESLKKPKELEEPDYSKFCHSSYRGCKPEEPYLIQYTSGATGPPKAVVVSAGAAAHNVRAARRAYDLHPDAVIVSWLPQYHDCGLMFLLLTVTCGATCVLTSPGRFVGSPMTWLHLVTAFRATCTPVPCFALPLVVKRAKENPGVAGGVNLGSLRNLILINEPIYRSAVEEFVEMFGAAGLEPGCVAPSYGLAENCTFVSTAWRKGWWFPAMPSHRKLLPCGWVGGEDEEIVVAVVNGETGEVVDDDVEGEIWVSSPSNASGFESLTNSQTASFYFLYKIIYSLYLDLNIIFVPLATHLSKRQLLKQ